MNRALSRPGWIFTAIGLMATLPFIVRRVGDPDYWWHELTGQWMVQHHAVAGFELYTYTVSGAPWTDHEYLSQLLFYGLNAAGGLIASSVFFGLVVWGGFWLLFARTRELGYAPVVAGAGLVLGAAAGFPVWGPRPQMFDFLFVALELLWIERFLSGRSRALYALPAVVLLWANLHGGFVFAFFFLVIAMLALVLRWLARRERSLLLQARTLLVVSVLSAIASLINPNGPRLFLYVLRTQFSSQLSGFVREWQTPDFHSAQMLPLLLMLLLVFAGFAWKRPRLLDVLYVVGSAVMALRAWLFIPIFVAATTPVLVWQWSEPWDRFWQRLRTTHLFRPRAWFGDVMALALLVVSVAAIGFSGYTLHGQDAATRANYPAAAADWLAAHPAVGTRLFNEYSWGGYIAARFYPQQSRRVFIYGESELMGDTLLAQYADINNLRPDWSRLLDQYRVDYILFPTGTPLVAALDASGRWQRVYSDDLAAIFVRAGTSTS